MAEATRRGGAAIIEAATGLGKTVATLAPLLEHAEAVDHKILYLVRTHSQEQRVLREAQAISHRTTAPFLALGLSGRQRRCFLLQDMPEIATATAEEYGLLCADRKRAAERALAEAPPVVGEPSGDTLVAGLPMVENVRITDVDGCPYYARLLQTNVPALAERFSADLLTSEEFDQFSRDQPLCAYELAKRLLPSARLIIAPYAFFFHPHVRASLLKSLGVGLDRIDLVVDEAHNVPEYLREMSSVSLGRETLKRARAELEENGNLTFPTGGSATELLDAVIRAMDEVVETHAGEEDGILPPHAMEDALLAAVGGTSHAFDTMLGTLAQWGEALRESRRRERKLPRSSTHAAALALLSWPQLEPPEFVKVVTRTPRVGIEAYAVDARSAASAVRECHTSIHLSGTLAPIEEYRVTLGLPEGSRTVSIPSPFPRENRPSFYDPEVTSRQASLAEDDTRLPQMVERLGTVLASLPVRTAVFFPSFALLDKALAAGLRSVLPAAVVIEEREQSTADLWRAIDGFKRGERDAVLVGVAGGRIAEGIDFPDDELEAVVLFGLPFPRPTARREALRRFLDATTGRGWEYTVVAPTRRAIAQAIGRMIRSDKDRGLVIVLDQRATDFPEVLTELAPLPADLPELTKAFYARPA